METNIPNEYSPQPKIGFLQGWGSASLGRLRFGLFLVLFYLIPYLAIWLIDSEMVYRHIIVAVAFIGLICYVVQYRYNWFELGFRSDTLKPALLRFGAVTFFFTLLMLVVSHYHWIRPSSQPMPETWVFYYYVLVAAPCQALAYKGFLSAEMNRVGLRAPWMQALVSGVLFSVLHLHYRDTVTLLITFIIGVVWGWFYVRHPNWLAVMLSHGALGVVAILTRVCC
jgi:membrane protease YdiL (CAAX protease family)